MSLIALALGAVTSVANAVRESKAEKAGANAAKTAANNVNAPAQVQQTQQPSASARTIQDKIAKAQANRAANTQPNKNMMYYVLGGLVLVLGLFFAFKKR